MDVRKIPIDLVKIGPRLREVSADAVTRLVDSIREVGLVHPIVARPDDIDGYAVVAGAHRLAACRQLGWTEIDAHIVDLSDLERQLVECDENLCVASLSPSERALFTQRRKEAYEALHPETRAGKAQAAGMNARLERRGQVGRDVVKSFTADTAAKTGIPERTIRRDAERGAKIGDEALGKVKGTSLDTGTYLDTLKTVPPEEQVEKVEVDLAKPKPAKRKANPPQGIAAIAAVNAALAKTAFEGLSPDEADNETRRVAQLLFDCIPAGERMRVVPVLTSRLGSMVINKLAKMVIDEFAEMDKANLVKRGRPALLN